MKKKSNKISKPHNLQRQWFCAEVYRNLRRMYPTNITAMEARDTLTPDAPLQLFVSQ